VVVVLVKKVDSTVLLRLEVVVEVDLEGSPPGVVTVELAGPGALHWPAKAQYSPSPQQISPQAICPDPAGGVQSARGIIRWT
jgi:hypothetical protein